MRDAEIVSKAPEWTIPRNFKPNLIVDLGVRTKFSSLQFAMLFPEAKILSFESDRSNFLLDQKLLAYHDNVVYKYFDLGYFDLDTLIYNNISEYASIDFIKIDVQGKEKNIFKNGGRWANNTKYLKAKLTDYNYKEAKEDLRNLGFTPYAMFADGIFYVMGEKNEDISGDTSLLRVA